MKLVRGKEERQGGREKGQGLLGSLLMIVNGHKLTYAGNPRGDHLNCLNVLAH